MAAILVIVAILERYKHSNDSYNINFILYMLENSCHMETLRGLRYFVCV